MSNNTVEKTKNRCIKDTLTEKEKMKVESGIEVESIDTTDSDRNIQETPGRRQVSRNCLQERSLPRCQRSFKRFKEWVH